MELMLAQLQVSRSNLAIDYITYNIVAIFAFCLSKVAWVTRPVTLGALFAAVPLGPGYIRHKATYGEALPAVIIACNRRLQ